MKQLVSLLLLTVCTAFGATTLKISELPALSGPPSTNSILPVSDMSLETNKTRKVVSSDLLNSTLPVLALSGTNWVIGHELREYFGVQSLDTTVAPTNWPTGGAGVTHSTFLSFVATGTNLITVPTNCLVKGGNSQTPPAGLNRIEFCWENGTNYGYPSWVGQSSLLKATGQTNHTGTSNEVTYISITIPAGFFASTNSLKFALHGDMTNNSGSTITIRPRVKFAGTAVIDDTTGGVTANSTSYRSFEFSGAVWPTDTTGKLRASAKFRVGPGTLAGAMSQDTVTSSKGDVSGLTFTSAQTFTISLEWSSPSTGAAVWFTWEVWQ